MQSEKLQASKLAVLWARPSSQDLRSNCAIQGEWLGTKLADYWLYVICIFHYVCHVKTAANAEIYLCLNS